MSAVADHAGLDVLLEAAYTTFTLRGFHGTSVRDIARGADRSVAALYHHVAGKHELLALMMDRVMEGLLERTRLALEESDPNDPCDKLANITRAHVLHHTMEQRGALLAATEYRSLNAPDRRRYDTLRRAQQDIFHDVIDEGIQTGCFVTDLPRDAGRAIVSMCTYVVFWYHAEGEFSPEQLADRYARLALSMLAARCGAGSSHAPRNDERIPTEGH